MNAELTHETLSPPLQAHVADLRAVTPDADRMDLAQRRLQSTLAAKRRHPRLQRAAWIGAAGAAVLALAFMLLPTLPGGGQDAFAAVQQQLRDFRTVHLHITQQSGGMALPTINVWADRKGHTRADIGNATSVIVDTRTHQMITLLHASHRAMRMPLPSTATVAASDPLKWLHALAHFDGNATRLKTPRVIDGATTHGWVLHTQGVKMTVWADHRHVPRSILVQGKTFAQRMHVTLDATPPPGTFASSIPDGYTEMGHADH